MTADKDSGPLLPRVSGSEAQREHQTAAVLARVYRLIRSLAKRGMGQ